MDKRAHTHTHAGTQRLALVPAALSPGLQTEHSIPFNHMCVSLPAARVSLTLSALEVLRVCVRACPCVHMYSIYTDKDLGLGRRNSMTPHSACNPTLTTPFPCDHIGVVVQPLAAMFPLWK